MASPQSARIAVLLGTPGSRESHRVDLPGTSHRSRFLLSPPSRDDPNGRKSVNVAVEPEAGATAERPRRMNLARNQLATRDAALPEREASCGHVLQPLDEALLGACFSLAMV
jgi:hypothetical protein